VTSTFFELGGNSISAIKLIFLLKKSTASLTEAGKKGIISVQQLFSSPTVRGIAQHLLPNPGGVSVADMQVEDDQSPAGRAAKAVQVIQTNLENLHLKMQLLCLSPGEIGQIPIILVNPAGASGMVYREFATFMDKKRPIFALDDGCIMAPAAGPNQYTFNSIREVAAECVVYIQEILRKFMPENAQVDVSGMPEASVYLAGWSYGGTVVTEIAQQLHCLVEPHRAINVKSLVLFDAPLRRSVEFDKHDQQLLTQHASTHLRVTSGKERQKENANISLSSQKNDKNDDDEGDTAENLDINEANAHQHYLDCTRLLQQYHKRPAVDSQKLTPSNDSCGSVLTCPILDIRPDGLNGSDNNTDLTELTVDEVHAKTLKNCSHFTMLLGQHAKDAAGLVEIFYNE